MHSLELVTGSPNVNGDDGRSDEAYDSLQHSDSESHLDESTVYHKLAEQ